MTTSTSARTALPALHIAHPAAVLKLPSAMGAPAESAGQAALESFGTVCRFGRNETVFTVGDEAKFSYRVVRGVVRLVKLMEDGRRHVAGFPMESDIFGLECTNEYAWTAEAVTDVVAIRFLRECLDRAGRENAFVHGQIMARLLRDLRAAQDRLVSLGCQTAKERVASFLFDLLRRSGARDGGAIPIAMGREDIADHLGVTVETICRVLRDLKADGAIAIPNPHAIVVCNVGKLHAAARSG